MLMKTFIEHLVGIEDVECAATYRAAVKGWQSGHYVAPGLAVSHGSWRRSEPPVNAGAAVRDVHVCRTRRPGSDADHGEQSELRESWTGVLLLMARTGGDAGCCPEVNRSAREVH